MKDAAVAEVFQLDGVNDSPNRICLVRRTDGALLLVPYRSGVSLDEIPITRERLYRLAVNAAQIAITLGPGHPLPEVETFLASPLKAARAFYDGLTEKERSILTARGVKPR